jgi:hypothetical protein
VRDRLSGRLDFSSGEEDTCDRWAIPFWLVFVVASWAQLQQVLVQAVSEYVVFVQLQTTLFRRGILHVFACAL